MQTQYDALHAKGVPGLTQGPRQSRPATLAMQRETQLLTADAGDATDDLVITFVDKETGQTYELTATGSATEATVLTNTLAAFALHPQLPLLFDLSGEVSTDVLLTFTAKDSTKSYTISFVGGPGPGGTVAVTQAAGGAGVPFGRFVARGASDYSFAAVSSGTALGDLLGVTVRTDGNHFRLTDGDTADTEDVVAPGRTAQIGEECRMLMRVENAVEPGDDVYLRLSGSGNPGEVREGTASGAALDISSIASFESSAGAGELAWVKIHMGAQ
jgi:hypothetical protein